MPHLVLVFSPVVHTIHACSACQPALSFLTNSSTDHIPIPININSISLCRVLQTSSKDTQSRPSGLSRPESSPDELQT